MTICKINKLKHPELFSNKKFQIKFQIQTNKINYQVWIQSEAYFEVFITIIYSQVRISKVVKKIVF